MYKAIIDNSWNVRIDSELIPETIPILGKRNIDREGQIKNEPNKKRLKKEDALGDIEDLK